MKLNYGDIFPFSNKPKVDDSNICAKLLITKQKNIDTFISLKSRFWMLKYFPLLKYGQKLQTF